MPVEHNIVLDQIPSKLTGYVHSVILPRRGFRLGDALPQINVTRRGFKIDGNPLARFRKMCGWESSNYLPFVYPLALSFHYHLSIFAHRDFPWSLRTVLGLRGRPKGMEFDIYTRLSCGGEAVWESVHVYYLRGNWSGKDARPVIDYLQPLDSSDFETGWDAPNTGGWEFARLAGDLNPVHYCAPWARLLGFKRDFCHTQRIISDCVQRLPGARKVMDMESLRLDVAFKGPVYYGSKLIMRGAKKMNGYRFNLYSGVADKPAIPGNIQEVKPEYGLLAEWE